MRGRRSLLQSYQFMLVWRSHLQRSRQTGTRESSTENNQAINEGVVYREQPGESMSERVFYRKQLGYQRRSLLQRTARLSTDQGGVGTEEQHHRIARLNSLQTSSREHTG